MLSGAHGACPGVPSDRCSLRRLAGGLELGSQETWARAPSAAASVLAPRQEERNCTGSFFMLRQLRLLSLNCVPDRELEPEVGPCALICPSSRLSGALPGDP